ncbi:general secretion pathway protein GspC [Marinobacter sediminum]|uniref:type II secretion system protein N n=1 Tax=Marinobacter sediminum TaxID=256323 RepID=UPI0020300141|nr:type II secretion system protein N [Marinobacter sediminum]MCM0612144.1 general secretion pathway protein GspC [Marinobacter sediminum]
MLPINQRLPLLLALVAGAAMLGVTAWQGYSFWQTESQQSTRNSAETSAEALPPSRQEPTVNLAALDLFGTATSTGTNEPVDTENLPETNLRLFLRGVLAADGEFPGSALIEDEKSKTEAYLVGDELPGNATLRSVHPNRVIIERSGKLENLFFPESEDRSGMSFAASNRENGSSASATTQSAPSSTSPSASGKDQRREEIRKRLEQLRERLRNNNN